MRHAIIAAIIVLTTYCIACLATPVGARADEKSKVNVKLSDPSRPCLVECGLINGGITVTSYNGREVIVETEARERGPEARTLDFDWDQDEDDDGSRSTEGLKKIPVASSTFEVEEDDNKVTISVASWMRPVDVNIKVPVETSLNLECINQGDIEVENVTGEVEAQNINGSISLKGITGSVVAYVQNGDITVELENVTKDKPMSFASFNGDVDVSLPASVKATVKISTHTGDAYSDFDIEAVDRPVEVIEDNEDGSEGKYRVRIEEAFYGNVNGGGPEFDFSTFNGDIFIRKAK
jgi:hypothetical protein